MNTGADGDVGLKLYMGASIEDDARVDEHPIADPHVMASDEPHVGPYTAPAGVHSTQAEKSDPDPVGEDRTAGHAVQPGQLGRA
jgi:hypothetical protein